MDWKQRTYPKSAIANISQRVAIPPPLTTLLRHVLVEASSTFAQWEEIT